MHENSRNNIKAAAEVLAQSLRAGPTTDSSVITANSLYSVAVITELGRIADALEGDKSQPVNLPPLKGMSDEANMAWAEYRNDYGVDPTDANHRAFHAGFKAGESNLIAQTSAMQNEIDILSRQSQERLDAYVSAYNETERLGLDLGDANFRIERMNSEFNDKTGAMQDEIDELSDEIEKLSVDYTLEHESVEGLVDELGQAEKRIEQLKSELKNQTERGDAAEKMMFYCNMDASDQSIMRSNLRRDIESLMKSPGGRSREFILDQLNAILIKDRGREFDARVRKARRENRDRA